MKYYRYIWILLVALVFAACKEDEPAPIANVEIEDIKIEASYREAAISWRVMSNATASEVIVEYGLDSTFAKFEQAKMSLVNPKSDDHLYSVELQPLKEDTQYFLRCRVANKINSFATKPQAFNTKAYQLAKVRTDSIANITVSSATLHATLLDWGTDSIPEVGFCVATHDSVTIADSCLVCPLKTTKDSVVYSVSLDNLTDNTTYHVRAYAKNSKGVVYGKELHFITIEIITPQVGSTTISNINYTTATVASEVLSDGGGEITERGICYSTTANPTIEHQKVACGNGVGTFECNIEGLTAGTTYYVRAYAINNKGTSYGDIISFTAKAYGLPSVITSEVTDISYTTATCGGNVTDDGGQNVTERGICYSTYANPTITDKKLAAGGGLGIFTCNLSGLKTGISYHVRAYAINNRGTVYGEDVIFTTDASEHGALYYTADSKLQETTDINSNGLHTNAFNVSIASHDFNNGEGIIIFSGKLTNIGNYAFRGCSGLISVNIPNSVTSIGASAFQSCVKMSSIEIPNSVTSIGTRAFYYCSNLTHVTIPDSIQGIKAETFSCCFKLTSVTIPNSVTSIGNEAFRSCNSLAAIDISNNATSIGNSAFYECTSLASIEIPNSVTSIGNGAFFECTHLATVVIHSGTTTIGASAFSNCSSLISLTLPNSITSIGDAAFAGCSGLTSVAIPNSVTSIGNGAFSYCNGLVSLNVAVGNTIYDSRNNCKAIIETATNTLIVGCKKTIIPNSVTKIGTQAFYGCSSLTSITIPNSVIKIDASAFSGCSGLTSMTIPNGVTSIGGGAFSGCNSMTSVTISNSVTSIGAYAFSNCSGLASVIIGNGVASIENYAFYGCSSLTSILCNAATPPTCQSYTFYLVPQSILVYVPASSVNAYKQATWWKDFTNILPLSE